MQNYQNNMRNSGRRSGCNCSSGYMEMQPAAPCDGRSKKEHRCEKEDALQYLPLAMAYVPWQIWKCPYNVDKALCKGTIFEELDKPFCGKGGCNR